MLKNRKFKFLLIAISILITILFGISCITLAEGAATVKVTYSSDGCSDIVTNSTTDKDLDSILLLNFGDDASSSWSHANISGTYTDANSATKTASYEAAFAGWKLVSINGTSVSSEYIYPDNDYIYFADEPFASIGTVSEIKFEAVWGKKIYVRDPYNFVNIQDVYGTSDADGIGNILTGKINWDTSTVFSADTNSGASASAPVATLRHAYDLLKNSYGGKIQIVNHLTLEGPAGQGYNAYDSNFTNNKSYVYKLGENLNISGVVTLTGNKTGSGKTVENKSVDKAATYTNAYLYIKNTNGAGTYKTNSAYSKVPTTSIAFYCDTVIEGLSSIAHRENYNINKVRITADEHWYNTPNNRLVIENDFKGYKRSTNQSQSGYNTTNWSHTSAIGTGADGSTVTFSELSSGFSGVTHIHGGSSSYGTRLGKDNYYLNIRGTTWYSTRGCEVGTRKTVNNVHMNLETTTPGELTIMNSAINCNLATLRTYDVTASFASATSGAALNANKVKYVIDGANNKKITNLYAGGYRSSVSSSIITTNADIDVILRGKATITSLYGGGNNISLANLGTINIDIRNGTVSNLYGGGQGGFVGNAASPATINIKTTGGTIGNIYGAGAGGFVQLAASNSPRNIASYVISEEYAYNSSDKYYLARTKSNDDYMYDIQPLTLNGATYQTVWRRGIYPEGSDPTNYQSYYTSTYQWVVSDALVTADINMNIGGSTKITGSVYGGGKNGAVTGDIDIKISDNATVASNVYAGGEGLNSIIDCTMDFKFKWTGVMADDVLTLDRLEAMANTAGSKFKSAPAAGNYTSPFIIGSELKASKYKHDDGYVYIYTDAIAKFGVINGNTSIEINNAKLNNSVVYAGSNGAISSVIGNSSAKLTNSTVKGIYGGGNAGGIDGAATVYINNSTINGNVFGAGNVADVTGNVSLTMNGTNTVTGSIYGGSNEGTVNAVTANISGTRVTGDIYAGGNMGNVATSVKLGITSSTAKNIYGGGYSGQIISDATLTLTDVTATEVFGGGYAGDVRGSTTLTVNSGTYERVFAGCDQAVVKGGTTTEVGSLSNPQIVISDVLYGGGRGVDADGDGNASDFITVEGNAIVSIAGMNTRIENYGSTKLGSVAGIVDVTFDTYRNDNSTKPYITMNGIDRATNVYLINSYIALENMNSDGTKEGIKNIDNLHVPAGSGLKVTADSEVTNNFNGGGYFYLDSEVTLTVGGDITGTTILVINPQLVDASEENSVESSLVIKGGIENAYLVVKGDSERGNIVCSDSRYASRQTYAYTTHDGVTAGFFYIDGDVGIDQQIDSILSSIEGVHYTESSDNWDDPVQIYQDGTFTTNIFLTYNFLVSTGDARSYRNVGRSIVLKESDITGTQKYFPAGTEITMIVKNDAGNYEYYKHTVETQSNSVDIAEFVNMETDMTYAEIKNIVDDDKTSIEGSAASSTIYAREETFRFVVDFTYCEEFVPKNTYILYMDIKNNNVSSNALSNNATNVIDIREAREYNVSIETENKNYEERSVIPTNVTIQIEASELIGKDRLVGYPLYAMVTVKDPAGEYTNLPAGTVVTINGMSESLDEGVARFEIIDRITEGAHSENFVINIDMSGCEPYQIVSGIYTFEYSLYIKDVVPEKTLTTETYKIMLNRLNDNYSVNGVFMPTLEDAIEYIETNLLVVSTIKSELNDSNLTPITIKPGYNITLDLNGKILTGANNTIITNNGTFNVLDDKGNGKIVLTGNNGEAYIILNNNILNVNAGTFETTGSTVSKGVIGSTKGTVSIKNAKISSTSVGIDLINEGTNLTVEDTIVTAKTNAINVEGTTPSNITLKEDTKMTSNGNCLNVTVPSNIEILDGEFVSTGAVGLKHTSTGTITIGTKDTNLNTERPKISGTTKGIETSATLNYYDGIVIANNNAPISKVADDMPEYCVTKVKQTGSTYTAYLSNIQNCTWNGTYYDTFQDAIDAMVLAGVTTGTIMVERGYTDEKACTVPVGMDVTINTNGKIVSKVNEIVVEGTLNVIGTGKIESTYAYTITNKGTFTLTGATIANTSTSTTTKTNAVINEAGATFTMNSGKVYAKSTSSYGASAITDNGGRIIVEDGEIKLEVSSSVTAEVYDVIALENSASVLDLKAGKVEAVNTKGKITGIKVGTSATAHIGNNDGTLQVANPTITSNGKGLTNAGSFYLYDGTIKGKIDAYTGTITDWAAGYEPFEFVDDNGYDTVFLTSDIIVPEKTVENFDDVSLEYVGAKVTITDNDRVDADSLKYLWTTRSTGVEESELTEHFINGSEIYAPFGVVGEYYLWIVAKDSTGNTVFGTDGHCFKLENPQIELDSKTNDEGKTEVFVLGFNRESKYKNYKPTANNNGTVVSVPSQHPTGQAWKLDKTGTAIQKHSLEGAFENEFSGLRANTYVVVMSDYRTSNAAGQTEFEKNKLYKAAYAREYITESVISNLEIIADGEWNHASEVIMVKEDLDSNGVIVVSGLPNWQASRQVGSMIIDGIQWFTIPESEISNGVAEIKWAYGEREKEYFASNGNVIENANSFLAVREGIYTVYMKTTEGREKVEKINVEGVETSKVTMIEWELPVQEATLPITGNVSAVIDWGDGNVERVTTDNPTHTYAVAGKYEVRIAGNVEVFGSKNSGDVTTETFRKYLTKVTQWGELNAKEYYFTDCEKLGTVSSTILPNTFKNVTSFENMFMNCTSLKDIDLKNWNTENIVNMKGMFSGCESLLSIDVSTLKTSKVTTMEDMFANCKSVALLDLTKWETPSLTNMAGMFKGAESLSTMDLSKLDTSKVTSMKSTFENCYVLGTINVSNFNVQNVEDFSNMFNSCKKVVTLDVSNFNTAKATNMERMFKNCRAVKVLDLDKFDTTNVENLDEMFSNNISLQILNLGENFGKFTGSNMFYSATALSTIITQRTTGVIGILSNTTGLESLTSVTLYVPNTDMEAAYEADSTYASGLTPERIKPILELAGEELVYIDLGVPYDEETDAGVLVAGFGKTATSNYTQFGFTVTIAGLPVAANTPGVYEVTYTAKNERTNKTLMTVSRTVRRVDNNKLMSRESYDYIDGEEIYYAIGASRANKTVYRADLIKTITLVDSPEVPANALDSWDASYNEGDLQIMVWVKQSADDPFMYDLYIGGDKAVIAPADSSQLFAHYTNCSNISGLELLNTSSVTDMWEIFKDDASLTFMDADISKLDVSKVEDARHAFEGCESLINLDLSGWETTSLTATEEMFKNCYALATLKLDKLVTDNVTSFGSMFEECNNLSTLTIGEWNTEKVQAMDNMFYNCKTISSLDLSAWDVSKVKYMDNMFYNNISLKTITLTGWNPENLESAEGMFDNCISLKEIDASNWKVAKLRSTINMFYNCRAAEKINVSGWTTTGLETISSMFEGCTNLKEIDVTSWNTSKVYYADYVFKDCSALSVINLSSWNTVSFEAMEFMFENCTSLRVIQLGKNFAWLDGTSIVEEEGLFTGCTKLTAIITERKITNPADAIVLNTNTGLREMPNVVLYVLDKTSETNYEAAENYASELGAERIRPILELVGDASISMKPTQTYTDEGATVGGLTIADASIYSKLGYTLQSTNNVQPTKSGRYQVVWKLYKPASNEIMSVTREVYIRYMPSIPNIVVKQGSQTITTGNWASGDLVVTLTGSTYIEGEMEYIYSLDGTTWQTGNEFIFDTETLSTTIHAKAKGIVYPDDQSLEAIFEIKLDKTVPEIVSHERIRYDGINEVIKLEINEGEVSSGIVKYAIGTENDITKATWQNSPEILIPDNGTWYLWVRDAANNYSEEYVIICTEKLKVEASYDGTKERYVDLKHAIDSLKSKGITEATLKLIIANDMGENVVIKSGSHFVIDMNGFDIIFKGASCLVVEGTCDIVNTSVQKSYITKPENEYETVQVTGTLNVNGNVQIESHGEETSVGGTIYVGERGTLNVNAGTILSHNTEAAIRCLGTANVNGGIVKAEKTKAIEVKEGGTVTLIGGTVTTESTEIGTIENNGTLNLGQDNADVLTDTPVVEGYNIAIDNNNTLNFYDGRLISENKGEILEGVTTNWQEGYHLVISETSGTKEMYLESNDKWIEYWDISERAGTDNVYAGIKVVSGDGISDNTGYKLVVGGSGNTKGFGAEWIEGEGWIGDTPWHDVYKDTIIELDLEEGVIKYGSNIFLNLSAVKELTLPNTLVEIGNGAFKCMTGIETPVNIPANVSVINAFNPFMFSSVPGFTVDSGNNVFEVREQGLYNKLTKQLIAYPTVTENTTAIVTEGTNSIGRYAFTGNVSVYKITLPETLTTIYYGAFESAYLLNEITIPSSVTKIYEYAFKSSSNLKNVYLKSKEFEVLEAESTFKGLAPNSIIYTESKEIADMFEADKTYTASNTKVYYPFKIQKEMENMEVERNTTLIIDLEVREGYTADDVVYQWYKDGVAIAGATSAIYTKESFQDTYKGDYKLVIKSALQSDGTYYYVVESKEGYVSLGDLNAPETLNTSVTYNEDGTALITVTSMDRETGIEGITLNGAELECEKDEERGTATTSFTITTLGDYKIEARDYAQNKISVTLTAYVIKYMPNAALYEGGTSYQIKIKDADIRIRRNGYERRGHEFESWNTSEDGTGTRYTENELYTANENLTVYAVWNVLEYVVRFYNDNGINGEQLVSEAIYEYGSIIEVPEEQYKTATEVNGDKYRIFHHDNNWIAVKTDASAKDELVNITEENKDNIVMIDSDVNYYAEYTYMDFSTTKSTLKVDGKANITGSAVGITNKEGLVILGENSTETANPTITGDIAIENINGIVLWYMGDFVGPVRGLVVEK